MAASAGGDYLGFVNYAGDLRVYDLAKRRLIFSPPRGAMPGVTSGHAMKFVAFAGSRVLWNCAFGEVCWRDLASGERETLLRHDPQDDIRHGITSADGRRFAFGTAGGRIFTFDLGTGEQLELKPRDVWSRHSASPIFTLEGTSDLSHFVSATSMIYGPAGQRDYGDQWWAYWDESKGHAMDIKYSGLVFWSYGAKVGTPIIGSDPEWSDKVRAAFSPDGRKLVVSREGGGTFKMYHVPSLEEVDLGMGAHCNGLVFADSRGRYVAVTGHSTNKLSVFDLENANPQGREVELGMRSVASGGRRILASYPERGWVFVGRARGGVDWYQFRAGNPPSIEYVTTLD